MIDQTMTPLRHSRSWIFASLYLLLAGVATYFVVEQATLYRQEKLIYAQQNDFKKRLLDMDEWLGDNSVAPKGEEALRRADGHYRQALVWAGALVFLSLLYLLPVWLQVRNDSDPRALGVALTAVALICLLTGLFTPMMELAAYERDLEIPLKFKTGLFSLNIDYTQTFEGDLYFYYQSKSIVELIWLLLRQHNFTVGMSILLFSVLIPLSKLLLSGSVLLRPRLWNQRFVRFVLERTGKWSMADVFVVALFLGYLAFSNMQAGIHADSRVLVGLYFFLAYCLLAIVLSRYVRPDQMS